MTLHERLVHDKVWEKLNCGHPAVLCCSERSYLSPEARGAQALQPPGDP